MFLQLRSVVHDRLLHLSCLLCRRFHSLIIVPLQTLCTTLGSTLFFCTCCMDVLPWRYWVFRRPSIFLVTSPSSYSWYWGNGRQLNFLINTSTLERCWSAFLGLPPRFGHNSFGAPGLVQQSPSTLPNSRGPVTFPCGLGRQRDHLYLYQNSQRSPLWSRRPFVSDLPLGWSHQAGAHERNG